MSEGSATGSATLKLARDFTVAAPRSRVWEAVADTDRLNALVLGIGKIELKSLAPDVMRAKGGLFGAEFDELPWVFRAPEHYRSERRFISGPLRSLITDVTLFEDGEGTRVHFAQEMTPRASILGRIVGLVLPSAWKRSMARLGAFLDGVRLESVAWSFRHPHESDVRARAQPFLARIPPATVDDKMLARLVDLIAASPDADISRIRPFALADVWAVPRKDVLATCLHATKAGLLTLSWDVLCPSCEQPPSSQATLRDLKDVGHCVLCDVDFTTSFERNVEATFSPSAAIRVVERSFFCLGSPARTKSWIAQMSLAAGATETVSLALGPGRYRIQASGVDKPSLLDVRDVGDASVHVEIPRGSVEGNGLAPEDAPVAAEGEVSFTVTNTDDKTHRVQIAHRAFASDAATALDVTTTGLYRDLFSDDVLAPGQQIKVGEVVILFTDLVGSTAMYEREGDAVAYGLVRDHFERLFAVVEECHGNVVKTVGDAVMAAFPSAIDGATAGLRCIEAIDAFARSEPRAQGLALRVGVHAGPCLAVDANGLIDYFGRTVNVAARVESLGGRNELVLSDIVATIPDVEAWLSTVSKTRRTVVDQASVKGVDREVRVTRVFFDEASS